MNFPQEQPKPDFFRFAVCAAGLTCLAVAFTSFNAGAGEPPAAGAASIEQQQVAEAQRSAERAAATESALRRLDPDSTAAAGLAAKHNARAIARAAQGFAPVDVEVVPRDWVAAGLDLSKAVREGDKLVQTLPNGGKVYLTLEPDVQARMTRVFDEYNVPHGGSALVEPDTGRVLALVSHSQGEPTISTIARRPIAPSASVFKVVTAAALIESAGVDPAANFCYSGGIRSLSDANIKGDLRSGPKCANLGDALAWSINSMIARLTYQNLSRNDLQVWAQRFGYNSEIPFELPVEISKAEFGDDPLERARAAAGFWHTYLSPLHGALIAASVANDGVMMQPTIVDKYVGPSGRTLYEFKPRTLRRVMSKKTATIMGKLMEGTADHGTARNYFQNRRDFPNSIQVSGKTGTLSDKDPYLGYTWFVGFARSASGKKAAVGGLTCNTPIWRIKGPWVASETLRSYYNVLDKRAQLADDEVATLQ